MIRVFLAVAGLVPSLCMAQAAPLPVEMTGRNPFTGAARPVDVAAKPTPPSNVPPMYQPTETLLSADFRTTLENLVLLGRTDSHALVGMPAPLGQSQIQGTNQSRALKTVSVQDGGTFYVAGRKVKLNLEQGGSGAYIMEARKDGQVLWQIDIESPRTVYPAAAQVEGPTSGGFGIGARVGGPSIMSQPNFGTNGGGGQSGGMNGMPR